MKVKYAQWLVFILGVILISGCGTAKGMAVGAGAAVGSTAVGVADDAKGLCHGIAVADNWIKNNLW